MTEPQDMRRGAPFRVTDTSVQGEFRLARAMASTVWCPICGQPAGETCLNVFSQTPLKYPAHLSRVREAQRLADQ